MKGLLQLNLDTMIQTNNYSYFIDIFKEYYGKLYIQIMVDNNIVFQNIDPTREIGEINEKFDINNNNRNLIVTISNYKSPLWNDAFMQWVNPQNIPKWFLPKLNYITLSFVTFFFILLPTWFALLMLYKAQHESRLLRNLLEELDFEGPEEKQ